MSMGDTMSLLDSLLNDLEGSNESFYGKRNEQEEQIYNEWLQKFEALEITPFCDANFLKEFLKTVPDLEQIKYVENTCKYHMGEECDHNFVIATRRAVPSNEPKPESFWSTEHRQVVSGLRRELPLGSPQRLHSVIMVTTIGRLENHGIATTNGGATDGEIAIIPTKPFSEFLFMYKPESEIVELKQYLENGGISRGKLLEQLKLLASERIKEQGFTGDSIPHK